MIEGSIEEIVRAYKKSFGKRYCFHPNANANSCQGKIVKAHTLQRNGCLSRIAKSGKVYEMNYFFPSLAKNNFIPNPQLRGIKDVSTFTGFCSYHDNQLFSPIEKRSINHFDQEQLFLLIYRTLCREIFLKRATLEIINNEAFNSTINDQNCELVNGFVEGTTSSLHRFISYKNHFDEMLRISDYSGVFYHVFLIKEIPQIACTALLQPDWDFNGKPLQDGFNLSVFLDIINFSLLPMETGGIVIFSWIGDSNPCKLLLESLINLDPKRWADSIIRYAFATTENLFFAPDWWDTLTPIKQNYLIMKSLSNVYWINPKYLVDDGVSIVNWQVIENKNNINW